MHARPHGASLHGSLLPCLALFVTAPLAVRDPVAGAGPTLPEEPRPVSDVETATARLTPPVTKLEPLTLEPGADVLELVERTSGVERTRLERARLWGRADVDEDPNGTWRRIVEQFAWAEIEVRDPLELESDFEPEAYWRRLTADASAEADWTRALYETRRRMIGNSAFYQEYERTVGRGETPPGEWFESTLASFDGLLALADDVRPFLGEAATASFRESAQKVRGLVADMASASGPDRETRVREIFSGMQAACFSCHVIRNHELGWEGPLVFPGLEERLAEQGVRDDLFRVGMDVWSPAGEDASAQAIADAVQAALLLVGSSS